MDVGRGDPGRRGYFKGGGCSAVGEQLADRIDEVKFAGPGRSDDDRGQLHVLRGLKRVGMDDVESPLHCRQRVQWDVCAG